MGGLTSGDKRVDRFPEVVTKSLTRGSVGPRFFSNVGGTSLLQGFQEDPRVGGGTEGKSGPGGDFPSYTDGFHPSLFLPHPPTRVLRCRTPGPLPLRSTDLGPKAEVGSLLRSRRRRALLWRTERRVSRRACATAVESKGRPPPL